MWDPAPPASCRHRRDPPIPRRLGFRRCEDAPGPLVQMGPEGRIAGANRGDVDHPLGVAPAATKRNPTSPDDPLPDSLIRGGALRVFWPSNPVLVLGNPLGSIGTGRSAR